METTQKIIGLWEGGLKGTGGALDPVNTFYYTIDFKWSGIK